MLRYKVFLAVLAWLGTIAVAWSQEQITIVTWGGAYEAAQKRAIFAPFTAQTGIKVNIAAYNGGIDALRQRASGESWDVIDMTEAEAIAACREGLLAKIDHNEVLVPARSVPLADDFVPGALRECSVAQNIYAVVFAYNNKDFPGVKPQRIIDFFDLERFPGKRALQRSPDAVLEWALMAEGVPASQVYDLLSTERGLRLAFRRLDTISDAIVWWQDAGEPVKMLADGRVVMASGFNGRFFAAANGDRLPITIVWDSQLIGYDVWAIPAGAKSRELSDMFVGFATQPDQLARLAEHIPYSPARYSALARVGLHWRSQVPMRDHLPNAPQRNERVLYRDSQWYARTHTLRTRRFEDWLAGRERR